MPDNKHENYEILNLIGYGLAKFGMSFVQEFGFKTKSAFYKSIVQTGIAETIGTVKNRQDLFDPFFENGRKGWWQKGNTYLHRKILIDSLFEACDVTQFAGMAKLLIKSRFDIEDEASVPISPLVKSKFKQLQITGNEAELYFMYNYRSIESFREGLLEDARLFGDGYDFQIQVATKFMLAEIKGIRSSYGSIRFTENEFLKAEEYEDDYGLVIVSSLGDVPKMTTIFHPTATLSLKKQTISHTQVSYHSEPMRW